jgi:HlyD family secretion protein
LKLVLRIGVLVAVLGLAAWGVRQYSKPKPVPVLLAQVEQGLVESTVANTRAGTVKACRRSKLAPATGGQVATLPVHEGDRVKKGQLLMTIWNEDLEAQVALSESEAVATEARSREACLTAEVAARDAQRLQRLRTQKMVSEEQVDRASTTAKARRAACHAARAAIEVSRARVDAARAAVARTVLNAPFDGIVAEVNAELGEFVTPSPVGIPTPPAVDLIDDRCLYITAPIDEVDAPAIRPGMAACVSLDAFPDRLCKATVRRIAPYVLDVEKQARTVEIEVEIRDAGAITGLLPGYSADVEVVLDRREQVLRVPTEAVLSESRVLVYRDTDARLEERTFSPGLANWRYTEVREGLKAGERIVVSVDRKGVAKNALVMPEEPEPGGAAAR